MQLKFLKILSHIYLSGYLSVCQSEFCPLCYSVQLSWIFHRETKCQKLENIACMLFQNCHPWPCCMYVFLWECSPYASYVFSCPRVFTSAINDLRIFQCSYVFLLKYYYSSFIMPFFLSFSHQAVKPSLNCCIFQLFTWSRLLFLRNLLLHYSRKQN